MIQYIAIGGGFYKQEGFEPQSVDVASGTRQAAHTMHVVGRGGDLVGISTAFDAYPIALVLSNDAIKRLGMRAYRHHLAWLQHRRVHAHDYAGARHGPRHRREAATGR
jgi:hypothetical protein